VKGNDDMRQDAALMHVFEVVDQMLKKHVPTRKRNLGIRTYKVIPLAPKAGLLGWVTNTVPLGSVLLDLYNKHHKPTQLTPPKCREIMTREFKRHGTTNQSRGTVLQDQILPKLPAVFHQWFEALPSSELWFEKRLMYARSCAASSIVGWLVGVGDRHSANILLDYESAEVIHIDLVRLFIFQVFRYLCKVLIPLLFGSTI
jgi:ataxia telangiectasia mutated family protein